MTAIVERGHFGLFLHEVALMTSRDTGGLQRVFIPVVFNMVIVAVAVVLVVVIVVVLLRVLVFVIVLVGSVLTVL